MSYLTELHRALLEATGGIPLLDFAVAILVGIVISIIISIAMVIRENEFWDDPGGAGRE